MPFELRSQTIELTEDEAEDDLQKDPSTSLQEVFAVYKQKGGTFLRLDANSNKYSLRPGDVVYPVCSGGWCRSQTLWALLSPYGHKIHLVSPHAARMGFDPYNGKVNWNRNDKEQWHDEFEQWASFPKATRIGYDRFASLKSKDNATGDELTGIKAYYDQNYYGPQSCPKGRKRIYFTFDKNTHAVMHRLNQANETLDSVVVVHLAFKDLITRPLPEWNTFPRSVVAYERFSSLLLQLIDLKILD